MNKNKTNLLELKKILIPDFQRSYAQGRDTIQSLEIRENLIKDIKETLESNKDMSLDFVYGYLDNGAFIPFDGQQRLTTLFLVHLYLLKKKGTWRENRISLDYKTSTECPSFIAEISDEKTEIFFSGRLKQITALPFLDEEVLTDNSVKGMIRTLSLIDENLSDIALNDIENRLRKITFSVYDDIKKEEVEKFYLRMNTRGLLLTNFENFRSKYSSYLIEERKDKNEDLKLSKEKANKIFDFFFCLEKKKDENLLENINERVMYIINSYFDSLYDVYSIENDNKDKDFIPFSYYKDCFESEDLSLEKVMIPIIRFFSFLTEHENSIASLSCNNDFWFSERLKSTLEKKEYKDYILFMISYFRIFKEEDFDYASYSRYMRVLMNLKENDGPNSTIKAIIDSNMSEDAIIDVLEKEEEKNKQIKEEIEKLKKIKEDENWREKIYDAEKTAFANGFISYLYIDGWDNFDLLKNNFTKYFDKNGVKKEYREQMQRSYIRLLPPDVNNLLKTYFFNWKKENWRDKIFSNEIYKDLIKKILSESSLNDIEKAKTENDYINKLKEWFENHLWFISKMTGNPDYENYTFTWNYDYPAFHKPYGRSYILCDLYEKSYTKLLKEAESEEIIKVNNDYKFYNDADKSDYILKPSDGWYDIIFTYKDIEFGLGVYGEVHYPANKFEKSNIVCKVYENGNPASLYSTNDLEEHLTTKCNQLQSEV